MTNNALIGNLTDGITSSCSSSARFVVWQGVGGWLLIKWADNKHVIGGNAIVEYSITILSATNRDSHWIIKWTAG